MGEEGPGKGWRSISIVTCPLSLARDSQGTRSCVQAQVLGNRMLP
jgi:hypothetical protein